MAHDRLPCVRPLASVTRDQKITEARRLREKGLSYAQIGERVGVTGPTVLKWLNPERARLWSRRAEANPERKRSKREWDEANDRRPCVRCGQLCGKGAHRNKGSRGLCAACRLEADHEQSRCRRQAIQDMWAAGATLNEIAASLGSTKNSVGVEISHMRADGWDVPHRHRGSYVEAA